MDYFLAFVIGLAIGAGIVLVIHRLHWKRAEEIARELVIQTETQKIQDLDALISRVKEAFGALSMEALSRNTDEFLKLARETLSRQVELGEKDLDGKKRLIDQTLEAMKTDLQKVEDLVSKFEKDREQKFGELTSQLKLTAEQTLRLQETANQLRTALVSSKVRGQWGERMAEDVLRLAGFIEGINYRKQKALEAVSTRPDYTFFLPQDLKVNMDVKFPLDNYLRYLEAAGESEKESFKNQFLRDVRSRIKEVTGRDYINPEDNTVDYVIVFIPNEQVYAFINENDSSVLDDALKNKVILCSPITLYAILAVIRQAVENFNLEKTASQIISLLGSFNKQWEAFVKALEKVGKKIEEAQNEYHALSTTRRKQLERPLLRIEELRKQRGIAPEELPEGGEEAILVEAEEEMEEENRA